MASFGHRVKLEQVVILSRELSIMIETGVPVIEALQALGEHADNATIRSALQGTYDDLAAGKSISQAMGAQPHIFPSIYVNMVKTAETGGTLDETLSQAADYLESSLEMRRKVNSALAYPCVLLFVSVAVIVFMMVYLLPRFKPLLAKMGASIPPTTAFMLGASDFLRGYWWLVLLALGASLWGMRTIMRIPAGKMAVTKLLHRLPVVGDIMRKVATARLLRSLGTLLGTGVPILGALETASGTASDVVFEAAMSHIMRQVEQGVSISEATITSGAFPPMICQMMSVGERSGRLSDVLRRVAQFYERDVDTRLKTLTSVLEPVMIVFLGLIVGFIAISIITPIYSSVGAAGH